MLAASALYRLGLAARSLLYRSGLRRPARLQAPVISVGNLTAGGSGKTPFVQYLARMLLRREYAPVILSRGYRGSFEHSNRIISNGQQLLASAAEAGDEPLLLARNLPGVVVVVGKRRAASAQLVSDWSERTIFLLDDGYQHRRLERDLDLLLVDASESLSSQRLLPGGRLREPLSCISRADAVILTRSHLTDSLPQRKAEIKQWTSAPVFCFRHGLSTPFRLTDRTPVDLDGQPVVALSGIAKPKLFERDLTGLGATVVDSAAFRDHHPYTRAEVDGVVEEAVKKGANWVVTTEKDAVRLDEVAGLNRDRILAVGLLMEPVEGDGFREWFDTALEELTAGG